MPKDTPIAPESIADALATEKDSQSSMTKTDRQARRFELSNPASISPRLTAVLADRFPPEKIAESIQVLLDATHADKHGNERPDVRAMQAALTMILHYTAGKPVERQEIINHTPDQSGDKVAELLTNPAMISGLEKLLKQAKGQVVDVPVESQ